MGDISAEPSMEDILSSIKRIIAEENDAGPARAKRPPRPAQRPEPEPFGHDEILELSEPVRGEPEAPVASPAPVAAPQAAPVAVAPAAVSPVATPPAAVPQPAPAAEALVSARAAEAMRGPLDTLSRLVVKPEVGGSDTLEGLVREMLRPMLRDWLDTHLPAMVETMVAREIDRITGK